MMRSPCRPVGTGWVVAVGAGDGVVVKGVMLVGVRLPGTLRLGVVEGIKNSARVISANPTRLKGNRGFVFLLNILFG